jgi:type VI secretion system secreted protein VgrG
VRVLGHQVTVVGDSDAQRSSSLHVEGTASSYSTGLTEIASETVLVLRCGESAIRMTPSAIEIFAPSVHLQGEQLSGLFGKTINLHAEKRVNVTSDQRVHLAGKQAAVDLLENARIDGKQVKLNCTPEPEPEGEADPPKPTTITLADEEGNPLGHQRFVVVNGDGSQRSGVTDDDGEASVLLDASGQIFFPDVDDARKE